MLNVQDFGAVGDGKTLCTAAIQSAIDQATQAGGGVILFRPGTYLSGSIQLKDNTTLDLQPGATLLGSGDLADYPPRMDRQHDRHPHNFICADGARNITLRGGGTIDGNGPAFWKAQQAPRAWIGAKSPRVSPMLDLKHCTDVRIENITIANSPGWTLHPFCCDRVWIRGIRLINPMFGPNTDGIDVNGCRDVFISDSHIECGDDAIVLKTTGDSRSLERVSVTNCIIRTHCVGLKLGANESVHDMRQVTFSNCVVYASTRAIGLYNWRGCTEEDIAISNIVCDTDCGFRLNRPIHIDCRHAEFEPGVLRNVQISNVIARTDGRILMTAADGYRVENVTLRDIRLTYPYIDDPDPIARDATSTQFSVRSPEARLARAAVVAENIQNLQVLGLQIDWPTSDEPASWWRGPRDRDDQPEEYSPQPDFSVLWGRGLRGGRFCAAGVDAFGKAPRMDLAESSIEICH